MRHVCSVFLVRFILFLKLNVQAYHGGEGGDGNDMEGVNVAICTMEKANSIVNRLAEEKRLQVRYALASSASPHKNHLYRRLLDTAAVAFGMEFFG